MIRLSATYPPSMAVQLDDQVTLAVGAADRRQARIDRVCEDSGGNTTVVQGELTYEHPEPPALPAGHQNIGLVIVLPAVDSIINRWIAESMEWPEES